MKYRVSTYRDGNGKLIYRPEEWAWWWPFWSGIEIMDSPWSYFVLEFDTADDAQAWIYQTITKNAAWKRERVRDRVA